VILRDSTPWTLEHAAIDQEPDGIGLEQEARTRDLPGGAEKRQAHRNTVLLAPPAPLRARRPQANPQL
jgi:hypothetical protein